MAAIASRMSRRRSFASLKEHGLAKHSVADPRLEPAFGHDIDRAIQEPLEIVLKPADVKQTAPGLHVHEKINIALSVRLTARDGPEHPEVADAMFGAEAQNLIAHLGQGSIHHDVGSMLRQSNPRQAE